MSRNHEPEKETTIAVITAVVSIVGAAWSWVRLAGMHCEGTFSTEWYASHPLSVGIASLDVHRIIELFVVLFLSTMIAVRIRNPALKLYWYIVAASVMSHFIFLELFGNPAPVFSSFISVVEFTAGAVAAVLILAGILAKHQERL